MPTLLETISNGYRRYFLPYSSVVKRIIRNIIILTIVALLLEVFVCNFRFFTTLSNESVNLSEKITLPKTDDGRFVISENNNTIEMNNINVPVNNVFVDLSKHQDAQTFRLKINFTDSAHSTYFDTTEYTVGVPEVTISTASELSQYFSLHTTGNVCNMKLQVTGDKISYPIYIDGLSVNEVYPFNFVAWRFLLILVLLLLCMIFRPGSRIYRIQITSHLRFCKLIAILIVVSQSFLLSAYLLLGSNLVGLASESYNYGDWDGTSIVNTFEVAGDNAQQYAELAKAMSKGQLYLDKEPPDYLKQMDNPYDKGIRDELQKQTGQPYLFDVGYYQGHYYVYFGVVPVVLFYLPFYLLTGANFPTAIGVLIMGLLFIAGLSILLFRFAHKHFKKVSLGLYMLLQMSCVMCCGVLYLFKFPTFYSIPIVCALAFLVWGLYFWMRGRSSKKPCVWYLFGSLFVALIAGCRPQIMLCGAVAIPLFWRMFITNAKSTGLLTKKGRMQFACLIVPFIVVAIGLMSYNYLRFGSFTDFGANYNLTMNDMTQRGMQLARVMPALFAYYLQPPNIVGVFPFVQPVVFATTYLGQTIKEVTFGGVLPTMPILWVLFFSPLLLSWRARQRQTHTVHGVVIVMIVSAVLIPILDAQVAGILQRYYADFSFMLLIPAALMIFIANEATAELPWKTRKVLMTILLVLVVLSVVFYVLTCFVVETGWYGDVYRPFYNDFLRQVMFWL